jgi:N-acetylneuraminic acid mutarotase
VIGYALAYAARRRATYCFGGASTSVVSGRTYLLDADGTTWVELDAMGPTPRYDAQLEALDERRLLLFGGSWGSRLAAFYADVWVFDSETETWTAIPVEGTTTARCCRSATGTTSISSARSRPR